MESLIAKMSVLAGLPSERIDRETTAHLIAERDMPVLQTREGQQVSFENWMNQVSREIYLVNKNLARANPVRGSFEYIYRPDRVDHNNTKMNCHNIQDNHNNTIRQTFVIAGTYGDFLSLLVNLILLLGEPAGLSPQLVEGVQSLYGDQFSNEILKETELSKAIRAAFQHIAATSGPRSCDVSMASDLPFEVKYEITDLIKASLDLIFRTLESYSSTECYAKILTDLLLLKDHYGEDLQKPNLEMFLTHLVKTVGGTFLTSFLRNEELTCCSFPLHAPEGEATITDEELIDSYVKSGPGIEEKISLQRKAPDRVKGRALVIMTLLDLAVDKWDKIKEYVNVPSQLTIFRAICRACSAMNESTTAESGGSEIDFELAVDRVNKLVANLDFAKLLINDKTFSLWNVLLASSS